MNGGNQLKKKLKIYNYIMKMEPVKHKNFKIGNYEYDSRINFYWFKIIDRNFHIILRNLIRFSYILYKYNEIINKYDYKIFNFKVYKRDKNI